MLVGHVLVPGVDPADTPVDRSKPGADGAVAGLLDGKIAGGRPAAGKTRASGGVPSVARSAPRHALIALQTTHRALNAAIFIWVHIHRAGAV